MLSPFTPCSNIRRRWWHPTPVLLLGKFHAWRSLVGCKESDTTERLHFHSSLSCTGEGNGNPLQCSCLENPRDGGAWWAAIYGVAQSQTRLKRHSSSSTYLISDGLMWWFLKIRWEVEDKLAKVSDDSDKVSDKNKWPSFVSFLCIKCTTGYKSILSSQWKRLVII